MIAWRWLILAFLFGLLAGAHGASKIWRWRWRECSDAVFEAGKLAAQKKYAEALDLLKKMRDG